MVFLPIFLFAAYTNFILAIRGLVLKGRDGMIAQGHFLCCLAGVVGVLFGFEIVPDASTGIAGDARNWSVAAFFAFGAMTVALFAYRLLKQGRPGAGSDPLTLRFGIALLALLAGLYVCGTAVDHWIFFLDSAKSGVADPSVVGADVKCGTSVLVRIQGDKVIYRCPVLIEFGRDYHNPFVPWPSYRQGQTSARILFQNLNR